MPRMDGMTAARHIRERDPVVLLMFITNMAQYAIRGYEVEALDLSLIHICTFFSHCDAAEVEFLTGLV